MQLRQCLQYLILWKRTRKTPTLIPHYTVDKPNPRTRLPNELLIEIINYHHDDRSTLYRLSLVSWAMRSIAQPLLFYQINDIRTMSSRGYIRFLRCRRKPYRHVLLFVRSFTIDFPLRSRPSLNNRDLLLSMSQVTHLTITLHHTNKKMGSVLQHCSEAFRLEELTVISEMDFVEDIPTVTNFISEQKHLKRLTIEVHSDICLDFELGALARLEALCANWVQICNILPGRPLIKTVAITEDPWIPNIHIEPALKRRLSRLHSVSVDVRVWMILHLGDYLLDLEILELTKTCGIFWECRIVSHLPSYLHRYLKVVLFPNSGWDLATSFPFKKLKVLVLNSAKSEGEWDSRRLADDLFLKFPSLEKVVLREVASEECFFRQGVRQAKTLGVKA